MLFLTPQFSFMRRSTTRSTTQTGMQKALVAHRHKKGRIAEGDLVLLSSKCLNSVRPSKKLDSKCNGPFPVTKESNPDQDRKHESGEINRFPQEG